MKQETTKWLLRNDYKNEISQDVYTKQTKLGTTKCSRSGLKPTISITVLEDGKATMDLSAETRRGEWIELSITNFDVDKLLTLGLQYEMRLVGAWREFV